ncbi:GAF domain-containing sensor histidine kinase [Phocicoccus pinnipedialis]|uniref:histidine kinase n=1 Tax=Phocicoccus pinnipedialis TaxID=110845 RepID=A0A6V7RL50_9BACL|nr:GAF domain-containing sensor histidine kinase [Jeotgalicoccus pinnipedialis]MBP1939607.1 signal transduction histidine kinase [Jeotgalicoccus pinnipedialis]CAD2079018.1 Sensor histidine kinase LiaS [Jeotgalicoccus pinnipedialis]
MKTKLQLLKDIAEFLNEETDKDRMLQGALKMLIDNSEFATGWVFFINGHGEHELGAHYKLPKSLTNEDFSHLTYGKCWCVNQYNRNNLEKATNIFVCSRLEKAARAYVDENNGITHHATVPLMSGGESYGLLNVATPYVKEFSQEELNLLESVAFQIGSTLKRIDLNRRERENILVQERQRLARDLHDSVNQMLFSINIMSNGLKRLDDMNKIKTTISSIEDTSKYAMREMKALIWQLKPIGLENGMIQAIEHYAKLLGVDVDIEINGFYDLDDKSEAQIFRVIQESLNNIKKHSGVTKAVIKILNHDTEFYLTVEDKGKGFRIDTKHPYSHGIKNMNERVTQIGGVFKIESELNKGTAITVRLKKKKGSIYE